MEKYDIPRDLIGLGEQSRDCQWPKGARIAVSICLNYEEGAERTITNGDIGSETALWERTDQLQLIGARNWSAESHYDYGSRAGFWRLLRLFKAHEFPFTLNAVGMALEKNPAVAEACVREGHEIAGHGYRWIDTAKFTPEDEKEACFKTLDAIKNTSGSYPKGWFVGRSTANSVAVLHEAFRERGLPLLWESDTFADDVPYWLDVPVPDGTAPLLMIPYAYDSNDMKFSATPGFQGVDAWVDYMKRTFDMLYQEGGKMMSLGLHCRVAGRPARAHGVQEFLDYIASKPDVWVTTRTAIAEHMHKEFPYGAMKAVGQ